MELTEDIKTQIKNQALKTFPSECCGFIVVKDGKLNVVACKNVAVNPKEDFQISPLKYVRVKNEGNEILAAYHSHPETNEVSLADIVNSEGENIPHVIYIVPENKFFIYEPTGVTNHYLGRKYKLGENDCLTLASEYYKNELRISIPNIYPQRKSEDFFKNERDNIWSSKQYLVDMAKAGFELVIKGRPKEADLRLHDCILTSFYNSEHPSHILVYLGNEKVLHQPRNGISRIEIYSEYFKEKTYGVARYAKRTS